MVADTDGGAPMHPPAQREASRPRKPCRCAVNGTQCGASDGRHGEGVRERATLTRKSGSGSRRWNVRAVPLRRCRVAVVCLREEAGRRRLVSVASRFRHTATARHVGTDPNVVERYPVSPIESRSNCAWSALGIDEPAVRPPWHGVHEGGRPARAAEPTMPGQCRMPALPRSS